jgi:uncharacterized membrane protein SirB2
MCDLTLLSVCAVIYSTNKPRVTDTLYIIFAVAMIYHYIITDPTDRGIVWFYKVCVLPYIAFAEIMLS